MVEDESRYESEASLGAFEDSGITGIEKEQELLDIVQKEIKEEEAEITHLHAEEKEFRSKISSMLSHLVEVSEENEREIEEEDAEISHLHEEEVQYRDQIAALQARLEAMKEGADA